MLINILLQIIITANAGLFFSRFPGPLTKAYSGSILIFEIFKKWMLRTRREIRFKLFRLSWPVNLQKASHLTLFAFHNNSSTSWDYNLKQVDDLNYASNPYAREKNGATFPLGKTRWIKQNVDLLLCYLILCMYIYGNRHFDRTTQHIYTVTLTIHTVYCIYFSYCTDSSNKSYV
jgi:hypothetical protein